MKSGIFKGLMLLLLICLPVMATLSDYGVTSDEPIYMEAAWNIKKWLSLEPRKIFNQEEIDRYWKTDPMRNIHPSGVKWLYLVAQKTILWEKNPYRQNGVLNVLVFSISVIVFLRWWTEGPLSKHIIFLLLLLTIPRFFAHIHFPATDIPMTSLLLLFVVCLERIFFRKTFWLTGVILGIFVSIKITSAILALPVLLVFLIWYRHKWKIVLPRIMLICMTGLFVFYILNPDYWFSPLSRCNEFLTQSLTRRSWTPFTVYFAGHFYSYRGPFYYPFVMFFITTPILHMLFLCSGLIFFFIDSQLRSNLKMVLVFTCLAFPFLLLALPVSPAHDGIRYLLPAFPFAVCFMTLGLEKFWKFVSYKASSPAKIATQWIATAVTIGLFAVDLHNPARYPPFELSYYNRLVGGLSGAHFRGYEDTYLWEILNDNVIKRLNKLCAGSYVYFPLPPTDLFFKHMLNDHKIEFLPSMDLKRADFMFIIGRPFVRFWESNTWPKYRREGKLPVPIWSISLDSVPLLRLYLIKKVNLPDQKTGIQSFFVKSSINCAS
jgi:hypothetical protein